MKHFRHWMVIIFTVVLSLSLLSTTSIEAKSKEARTKYGTVYIKGGDTYKLKDNLLNIPKNATITYKVAKSSNGEKMLTLKKGKVTAKKNKTDSGITASVTAIINDGYSIKLINMYFCIMPNEYTIQKYDKHSLKKAKKSFTGKIITIGDKVFYKITNRNKLAYLVEYKGTIYNESDIANRFFNRNCIVEGKKTSYEYIGEKDSGMSYKFKIYGIKNIAYFMKPDINLEYQECHDEDADEPTDYFQEIFINAEKNVKYYFREPDDYYTINNNNKALGIVEGQILFYKKNKLVGVSSVFGYKTNRIIVKAPSKRVTLTRRDDGTKEILYRRIDYDKTVLRVNV
nr:hypothetical protein [Lachnospiraceae bacterium]